VPTSQTHFSSINFVSQHQLQAYNSTATVML